MRNPLSLRKLVYLDRQQAVLYRSRMNPSLGRNFEALDPLAWQARMSKAIICIFWPQRPQASGSTWRRSPRRRSAAQDP